MILVDKQPTAIAIWEELRKNPGGFEKIAQEQSMDTASRSLGGLLAEPITRHAYPQNLSDAAFYQLVDGDPADRDPSHKPKDGDFTGPIQVGEMVWVILRRESVVPADKTASLKDERVAKQTYEMIYEVKLKEAMQDRLQGADQGRRDRKPVDRHRQAGQRGERSLLRQSTEDVKLMGGQPADKGGCDAEAAGRGPSRERSCRPQSHCLPEPLSNSRSSSSGP